MSLFDSTAETAKAYLAAGQNASISLHREPLLLQLRRQKVDAQNEVQRLDELIKLLEANPATERILELLGRR
jgi:hypothetical protein